MLTPEMESNPESVFLKMLQNAPAKVAVAEKNLEDLLDDKAEDPGQNQYISLIDGTLSAFAPPNDSRKKLKRRSIPMSFIEIETREYKNNDNEKPSSDPLDMSRGIQKVKINVVFTGRNR